MSAIAARPRPVSPSPRPARPARPAYREAVREPVRSAVAPGNSQGVFVFGLILLSVGLMLTASALLSPKHSLHFLPKAGIGFFLIGARGTLRGGIGVLGGAESLVKWDERWSRGEKLAGPVLVGLILVGLAVYFYLTFSV